MLVMKMLLKDSEKLNDVKLLHSALWDKLQEMEEDDAEEYLKGCIDNLGESENPQPIEKLLGRIAEFMKERGLWIAVAAGILCPLVLTFFLLWAALIVE